MGFGEKLSRLRKSNSYTQEDLAEKLGVSRQAVARWEAEETSPDINILLGICEVFGVSADYMIHDGYESDEDIPAVREKSSEVKVVTEKSRQHMLIAAIGFAFSALCSTIGFGLLAVDGSIPFVPSVQLVLTELSIALMMIASVICFVKYFKKQ
ncbi:MAG: helix-turn-helix domain-containing protein [Oscillospiraceae bacterium]|nr:helix-turn-helix domain-containing protein [Oscillospiraceae bacterium]